MKQKLKTKKINLKLNGKAIVFVELGAGVFKTEFERVV